MGQKPMAETLRILADRVETGELLATLAFSGRQSGRVYTVTLQPVMVFEDELPEPMDPEAYIRWFAGSRVVDGVRMGPLT